MSAAPSALARHEELTRRLGEALERSQPAASDPFRCPYLPDREARHITVRTEPFSSTLYHGLMDLNFRRLGRLVYRPACEGCAACRMLRIPIATFQPTRAQRRAVARNHDVTAEIGEPRPTAEKLALYRSYLGARHTGTMTGTADEFERFLYSSDIDTFEVEFRVAGRLLGVGLVDAAPLALSAVYFYFDPAEERRSPGVFNVLWLVEEARRRVVPWLYLGYYVEGAPTMSYKAGYGPHERLDASLGWEAFPP